MSEDYDPLWEIGQLYGEEPAWTEDERHWDGVRRIRSHCQCRDCRFILNDPNWPDATRRHPGVS